MKTYNNSIILKFTNGATGNAGAGRAVTVRFSNSGNKAILYDELGAEIDNPVFSDNDGNYSFTIDDGTYNIIIDEGLLSETIILDEEIIDTKNDKDQDTTENLINSKVKPRANEIITTYGYKVKGDDGGGDWQFTGLTGLPVTMPPSFFVDSLLTDANGNEWRLVNSGTIEIKKLGALFDGVTNDTPVFRAALNSSAKVIIMPVGTTVFDTVGVTIESDQSIIGQGRARTFINIAPDASTIMFTATLAAGGFNTLNLKGFSVITSGSVIGQSILKTPQDADGFSDEHSFQIDDLYALGTKEWTIAFDIGDSLNSSISNIDLRGIYNTAIDDAGQPVTTGIKHSAAANAVGLSITKFKMSGYRTSIEIGDNIEAFYITDGEATNSFRGIHSIPVASKPGGVIDNIHISANGGPIKIARRRNFNISNVQLYRTTGVSFDHSDEWVGLLIDECSRFNLTGIGIRHPDDYKSSPRRIGLKIISSFTGSVASLMTGYEDGLTSMLDISISSGISSESMTCNTTTENVISIRGACSDLNIGPVSYLGIIPAVPVFIETPDISIRISRESSYIQSYHVEGVDSSTPDSEYYAGISPKHTEIVDIESTTPYSTVFRLFNLNALFGDEFSFTVVIPSTAHGSIFIRNEDSSVEQEFVGESVTGSTWIFTGDGWEVKDESRISSKNIKSNTTVFSVITTTGRHMDIGASATAENRWFFSGDEAGSPVVVQSTGIDANIDMRFVPKGTGRMRYGIHSAVGGETITGYIEIKDGSGNVRKLAVIS